MSRTQQVFIPLHTLSRLLGLPAAWIKAEVDGGRIPYLRVGRRVMFNREAVEAVLNERSHVGGKGASDE
ncbi:MAG: helix-turn-helix domain-containing protein [Planctomycetes bacterium]|nr:helix-turn-helix domain-containing protein [Planctomycetota bacterium]